MPGPGDRAFPFLTSDNHAGHKIRNRFFCINQYLFQWLMASISTSCAPPKVNCGVMAIFLPAIPFCGQAYARRPRLDRIEFNDQIRFMARHPVKRFTSWLASHETKRPPSMLGGNTVHRKRQEFGPEDNGRLEQLTRTTTGKHMTKAQ